MAYPSNMNTSNDSSLFAPLVTQAQYQAYETSIARQLVTVFDAPLHTGKQLQVPVYGRIAAQLITDESAATNAATGTTSQTITLGEHVVYEQITDQLRDSAYNDVFAQIGDQAGRAIAESMDRQVFSNFSNFSSDIGGTGHELIVQDILRAAATLRSQRLSGPFFCVVHPAAAYNLKKNLTTTLPYSGATAGSQMGALSNLGNTVLDGFYLGSVSGVAIFESSLVPTSGTDSTAGVFAMTGLGHAMRGGIDLNTLYLPANRATDVVLKAVAGASVLNTVHGVAITCDAQIN